jgi:tetratricopeptide (TPR) repeat protein
VSQAPLNDEIPSMNRHRRPLLLRIALGATLCAALAACTTSPSKTVGPGGIYDYLSPEKSDVAYATEMPVGSANEAIKLGDTAFRDGDLDKALFEYIRALKKEGDNSDTLYKIGVIHAARGNAQLAETAFRWALKGNPQHAGALAGLGIQLTKKRQYEEAQSKLLAAVRANPRMVRAHNALGVIADIQRSYKQAQQHYESALSITKDSPELWNNLGYSRYLSGNRSGAIAAYKEALRIDANYERAWRNLALVYARNKQYDEAIEALSKVQDLPKAYNDVGYVAMVSGRLRDAEGFFDEAERLSPEYYELAELNSRRLQTLMTETKVARR